MTIGMTLNLGQDRINNPFDKEATPGMPCFDTEVMCMTKIIIQVPFPSQSSSEHFFFFIFGEL